MRSLVVLVATLLLGAVSAVAQEPTVDDVRRLTAAQDNDERFDALTALLKGRGVPFTVEPFTIDKPVGREPRTRGRNVVVTIGEGTEDVVVGAHYDAARLRDGSLSRGAVDNAASSVMLVGLASALRGERLSMRARIVWFDMEEIGLLGSLQYLRMHTADRIRVMLNFDINGYGDTVIFGAPEGGDNPALRRTFLQTCAEEGVDCNRFGQLPSGDDRSFGKAGIPTLSIAHLPSIEAHQLWLLLNSGGQFPAGAGTTLAPPILRTLHTADDVIEKVDGATLSRAQRFAAALVKAVAR